MAEIPESLSCVLASLCERALPMFSRESHSGYSADAAHRFREF